MATECRKTCHAASAAASTVDDGCGFAAGRNPTATPCAWVRLYAVTSPGVSTRHGAYHGRPHVDDHDLAAQRGEVDSVVVRAPGENGTSDRGHHGDAP